MPHQYQPQEKIVRVMNAVAAGTTDQTSSSVDMSGFESVEFIALFGTLTASQVTQLKAQTSSDDSTFNDLAGTQTAALDDDDDNDMIRLEIVKPRERYIRCIVERATANAVIDGVIAILRGPATHPITEDATVQVTETHVSPAEGTA